MSISEQFVQEGWNHYHPDRNHNIHAQNQKWTSFCKAKLINGKIC